MAISENLAAIRKRIATAAIRSSRDADAITLVAVSKYVDVDTARKLASAGCRDLGEARPQELIRKATSLAGENIRWHLIGHLQTNKVKRVLPYVSLIHSVDSTRLLNAISIEAETQARRINVLLEVNISGDVSKHGFASHELAGVLRRAGDWPGVHICGLMGMAALEGGVEVAKENFWQLRRLRDELFAACPPCASLYELSMGMSGDYEVAIEAGATIIRVGSALFDEE